MKSRGVRALLVLKWFRMKKYWAIVRCVLQDQLEYPAEIFYWLFLTLIRLFVMSYLWLTVYQKNPRVGGFTLSSMITYYFLAMIINRLNSHTAFWISDMIKRGTLSGLLLRPFSFLHYVLVRTMSRKFISFGISLPIILLVYFLLRNYVVFPPKIFYVFSFFISVLLSITIFAFLGFTLGLISFWTLEIGSIFYFYYTLLEFLGGAFLPLSFFPKIFIVALDFLPFKYLFYFPITVYLGKTSISETITGLFIAFIWLFLLYLFYKFIWALGMRRYSSLGG